MIFVTGKRKIDMAADEKFLCLEKRLKELGRVAVAFSGGVDSSFLAYAANRVLGNQAFAISIWSPLLSSKDRNDIFSFAERYNIPLIRIHLDETESVEFCANTPERCYICKSMRLKNLEKYAKEWSIPWILDGTNTDDLKDYRPGMRALKESKLTVSPLLECGFTKADIRKMSALFELPTAEKPAAACLASRIPTRTEVRKEILTTIDICEDMLRMMLPDNTQIRLRYDGTTAKIETDRSLIAGLSEKINIIEDKLAPFGIHNVLIEQDGYSMGSVTSRSR